MSRLVKIGGTTFVPKRRKAGGAASTAATSTASLSKQTASAPGVPALSLLGSAASAASGNDQDAGLLQTEDMRTDMSNSIQNNSNSTMQPAEISTSSSTGTNAAASQSESTLNSIYQHLAADPIISFSAGSPSSSFPSSLFPSPSSAFTPRDPSSYPSSSSATAPSAISSQGLAAPTHLTSSSSLAPSTGKRSVLPSHLSASTSAPIANSAPATTDVDATSASSTLPHEEAQINTAPKKGQGKTNAISTAKAKVIVTVLVTATKTVPAAAKKTKASQAGLVPERSGRDSAGDDDAEAEADDTRNAGTPAVPRPQAKRITRARAVVASDTASGSDTDGYVPRNEPAPSTSTRNSTGRSTAASSRKVKTAASKKRPAKITKINDDGVEVTDSEEEILAAQARKRRRPIARAKPFRVDRLLRGELDVDDNGNIVDVDESAQGDVDGEESGDEGADDVEDGEEQDDDNAAAPVKKKRKRTSRVKLAVVDPSKTTMFELANSRDFLEGRVSGRFASDQLVSLNKKAARKVARERMKARQARKDAGEPSEDEEEAGEGEEQAIDNGVLANGSGQAAPADAKGKGRELVDKDAMMRGSGDVEARVVVGAVFGRGGGGDGADEGEDENAETVRRFNEDGDEVFSDEEDDDDDGGAIVESQYVPQMRIVDGQMMIDDASLEIDRSKDARVGHVGPREVVEELARDRFINSATWGKQKRTEKWTLEETDMFYNLLRQFGTDFEMIARLFPSRTRNQIKSKWQKEDKTNPDKITDALYRRKDIDLVAYAKVTGADLSGPVPEDPYEKVQKMREAAEVEAKGVKSLFGRPDSDDEQGGTTGKRQSKKVVVESVLMEDARKKLDEEVERQRLEDEEEEEEREGRELDAKIAAAEAAANASRGIGASAVRMGRKRT